MIFYNLNLIYFLFQNKYNVIINFFINSLEYYYIITFIINWIFMFTHNHIIFSSFNIIPLSISIVLLLKIFNLNYKNRLIYWIIKNKTQHDIQPEFMIHDSNISKWWEIMLEIRSNWILTSPDHYGGTRSSGLNI